GERGLPPAAPVAGLSEQDGVLSRVKARLAGAQQVMLKPLVRQRIVALVSWYRLGISDPEADLRTESLSMTMARQFPVEKRIRAMEQTREASCELASEAVDRIPWLRRRLLSWFEQSGRSFPWREPGRTPYE